MFERPGPQMLSEPNCGGLVVEIAVEVEEVRLEERMPASRRTSGAVRSEMRRRSTPSGVT